MDASSGEEDEACAAATGNAVAVARAAQRRVLVASLRQSLSAAAADVAELQKQWATQLESDPEQQHLSADAAAFWHKKRRLLVVRHCNSFGLPISTNTQWWENKLSADVAVPQALHSSCLEVAAEVLRLARQTARSGPASVDGKRSRAGPGLFTANSAKAFLERIEAVEALRGVFRDANCDGPLARAVAALVPLHTCPPSRVKLLGMPMWWVIGRHDVALVDGVLRHGWGNLAAMAADETLPFGKHMARNEGDEDEGGDSDGEGGEGGAALTRFRPFGLRLKDLAAACPSLLLELQDIM
jgi:hypothetical protein